MAAPADTKTLETKPSNNRKSLDEKTPDATSPTKSRGRSWIQRLRGKSNAQEKESSTAVADQQPKTVESDAPITRADSMQNVAMAGRTETNETDDLYGAGRDVSPERPLAEAGKSRNSSVSSLSRRQSSEFKPNTNFSLGTTEAPEEDTKGDEGVRRKLLKKIKPGKEKSNTDEHKDDTKTATTDEEFEEARDTFDDAKLAPPPALSSLTGENTRALSPKGSRERSRFTEEL